MENTLIKKEQLQKELNALIEQEQQKLLDKYYPYFKGFENKYFKYRNSYSCPEKKEDYWYMYSKVLSVTKEDLYVSGEQVLAHCTVLEFQTDKYGQVHINPSSRTYTHSLQKQISEKEFLKAWEATLSKLNNLITTQI